MIKRDLVEIAGELGCEIRNGNGIFSGFAIDSRKVNSGDMFICIKGENTDGHLYAQKAVENGATAILAEHEIDVTCPYIIGDSSVALLQKMASLYREKVQARVVGITGSVGKTTTKEFISSVLSQKGKTHKTEGNKNSETGLPITILGIEPDDKYCVAEMGMSGFGEISVLTGIARPDYAVITNVGYSHIEMLGSREGILKAKMEIVEGLKKDGTLILNGDDDMLIKRLDAFENTLTFGIENKNCDIVAENISIDENRTSFTVRSRFADSDFEIVIPAVGKHYIYDSLSAILIGLLEKIDIEKIKEGIASFSDQKGRSNIYQKSGYTIIDDTYNAVPASIIEAVDNLKLLSKNNRRIVVLGDMLELGTYSNLLHTQVGLHLTGIDRIIIYGKFARYYGEGAVEAGVEGKNIYYTSNVSSAAQYLKELAIPGDYILFKASRGMRAEKVIEYFFS